MTMYSVIYKDNSYNLFKYNNLQKKTNNKYEMAYIQLPLSVVEPQQEYETIKLIKTTII